MDFNNLSDNRYVAVDELRVMLGFKQSEWKYLLIALSKTDNGCLEFMFGDWTVTLKKFVDIDEIRLQVKFEKGKTVKTTNYTYELNELLELKRKNLSADCKE
jgi:hypothetical protein